MPTTQVGSQPVKIVDISDPQGIVYNRSTTNQVLFGPTASSANRADASILDVNATLAVDTDAEVWMSCPTGTALVDYMPHGAAFFRALTSGLGALVIPSIRSPNFQHNVSGWSINSDGSAEFNNGTFRGTITGSKLIITNSFGATVMIVDPAHDGLFVYNDTGSVTQGALIGSITGNSGTDPVNGTPYKAGVNAYVVVSGTTYAIGLNVPGGPLNLPGLSIQTTAGAPNTPSGVYGQSSNSSAVSALWSGTESPSDVASYVDAQSASHSGITNGLVELFAGLIRIGRGTGTIAVDNNAGVVQYLKALAANPAAVTGTALDYVDINTYRRYLNSTDGRNYNIGHTETSAVGQGLTTSVVALNGTSFTVEATSYLLEFEIFYTGTAGGGVPTFTVTGAAASFSQWEAAFVVGGAPASFDYGSGSGFLSMSATGPAVTASQQKCTIKAWITFSAAGTIQLQGKMSANTATINGVFSRMERRQ